MRKKRKKSKGKRIKIRLPLPRQSGRPLGTPKGKRGYDRKRGRRDIEREMEE